MNSELLLSIKKHTDTLIEHTKSRPKETLELKMNKRMENFSFKPPINLVEERNCLLAVSSFKTTNTIFNITDEKNNLTIFTAGHWNSGNGEELINKPNKVLELMSRNHIELHVEKDIKEDIK